MAELTHGPIVFQLPIEVIPLDSVQFLSNKNAMSDNIALLSKRWCLNVWGESLWNPLCVKEQMGVHGSIQPLSCALVLVADWCFLPTVHCLLYWHLQLKGTVLPIIIWLSFLGLFRAWKRALVASASSPPTFFIGYKSLPGPPFSPLAGPRVGSFLHYSSSLDRPSVSHLSIHSSCKPRAVGKTKLQGSHFLVKETST